MTYGLGAIQSPPDERDFDLAKLYADTGTKPVTPPPSFNVATMGPVLNQGTTPECVAFSGAGEQASFDLAETGHNYLWDEGYFFKLIGGGPNGAIVRNAFAKRLSYGYPLLPAHSGNSHLAHRISAYYAVPVNQASIEAAISQFGAVVFGLPWYNSWFTPGPTGILPPADYQVGGHAIVGRGYTPTGVVLRNSWGATWGVNGDCTLPWGMLSAAWECWKATVAKP